jgi:DNA polymerase III subunit gamma/tau
MATLYRKYRPQTFAEAVGQNHIKLTIQSELATGKVAHAYLFCGPRAVGKTTFARLLAKSVNCLNRKDGQFEPCDKCESCQEITINRALDIIEIDAASNTGVDNVRENIIASARVSPSKSKYKVFIIDEVHMLSISAFNALLKVLEEPPQRVIFILCTTETHKVPATIISRCERFDFRRIGMSDIVKKLSHIIREEKIKIDKEILEAIARQSEGHMRDAESLLGQLVAIGGQEITKEEADLVIPRSAIGEIVKLLECLAKKDASTAIALVNKMLDDGVDLEKFALDLVELLRKILIYKINPVLGEKLGLDIGETYELKVNELKKDLSIERIVAILEKVIFAKSEMRSAFITQLPLEMAIAELCLDSSPSIRGAAPTALPPRNFPPATPSTPSSYSGQALPPSAGASEQKPSAPINSVPAASTPVTAASADVGDLAGRWSEFLAKIKKNNHALSFILRTCQPRGVDGSKVCLAFKYKFHQDRVNEAKMKEVIQNTLKEVYGANLYFEAIIDENMEIEGGNGSVNNGGTETGSPAAASIPSVQENVPPPAEEAPAPANDVMSNLLKTFGGKVVG